MKSEFLAMCFQYGGQIVSSLLKNRAPERRPPPAVPHVEEPPVEVEEIDLSSSGMVEIPLDREGKAVEGASSIEAGCVPCALGHISTCSGALAEATRFARSDGLRSNQVIDRIGHCLEELNIMEREDLSPQKIASLPKWEKDLAVEALNVSRKMRHDLEGMSDTSTVKDLEQLAAGAQDSREYINRGWFKHRLSTMSGKEKTELVKKTIADLEEEA
jgi:hypothetical protein